MHLIYATSDYKISSQPVPGFPIILREDMRSCEEANDFLRYYLMRGGIGSRKSWEPIARSLYDYFGFLQAHELAWDDVDRGEEKNLVAAYRDYCFHTANLTRNTVRLRLRYVCEYYKYAERKGWIKNLPYQYEVRHVTRTGGFLSHVDGSGGTVSVASIMPRKHRTFIKFLSKDQIRALLGAATNPHHQIIILLALHSGLRREELATFPKSYVFDPLRRGVTNRNVSLTLDPEDGSGMKTKGSKARTIYMPTKLMRSLHHYLIRVRGERASLVKDDPMPLFLNQFGKPWAADGKGIEAMVRKIGAQASVRTHPHMLRHSYATHTLVALQRQRGDAHVEPLVFLQKQLGHASITTTMEYLHLVNELVDDAVLAYDDELNEWMEGASNDKAKELHQN